MNDQPTAPMPDDSEDETRALPEFDDEPTVVRREPTVAGDEPTVVRREPAVAGREPRRGFPGRVAVAISILAGLLLCGTYIALGSQDFRPQPGPDPCVVKPWGSPDGIDEIAERFSMAALDGAACKLGVSRESLSRALATSDSPDEFLEKNGLTDDEFNDGLRTGLLAAVDQAEEGGTMNSVTATGARAAIKVLPMGMLPSLIQNASKLFAGDALNDGLFGILGRALGADGAGSLGDLPAELGNSLLEQLKEQLPEQANGLLPDSVDGLLPDDLRDRVQQGLEDLFKP